MLRGSEPARVRTAAGSGAAAGFPSMGTVISLRLGEADGGFVLHDDALDGIQREADHAAQRVACAAARAIVEPVFHRWDERFSLYRESSELSRIARGDIRLPEASEAVRDCYALALDWRDRTDGVFTPHRADGVIDLSGVVKALAIAESDAALRTAGLHDWTVNAGGDILVCGGLNPGSEWTVSIVNPRDRLDALVTVPLRSPMRAVATSGSAERGEHIWTPAPGGLSPFWQVSVFAADIVTADVLATAIVAGGEATLNRCTERFSIDVFAVLRDGQLLATPGLRQVNPARTDPC